jgi:prefoldin subunit 5
MKPSDPQSQLERLQAEHRALQAEKDRLQAQAEALRQEKARLESELALKEGL